MYECCIICPVTHNIGIDEFFNLWSCYIDKKSKQCKYSQSSLNYYECYRCSLGISYYCYNR